MDIYLLLHTIYVLRILKNAHVSQIKTSNKIDSNWNLIFPIALSVIYYI